MGSPSLGPKPKEPSPTPSLLDPTVMFMRKREQNKARSASGRASTILSSAYAPVMPTSMPAGAY